MAPEPAASLDPTPELNSGTEPGSRMSFGDHLDELRNCLMRALLGLALAAVVALVFGKQILAIVFEPLLSVQIANGLQPRLQALSPADTFGAYLRISFLAGLILAMPWVLYQLWGFVASGLYAHERRFVKQLTIASAGLFAAGVLFLYFLVLPVVLQFFITFNRTFEAGDFVPGIFQSLMSEPPPPSTPAKTDVSLPVPTVTSDPPEAGPGEMWINTTTKRLVVSWGGQLWSAPLTPGSTAPAIENQFAVPAYISFVLMLALAFGIAFETPIVVVFLSWSNLMPAATMAGARRYVIMAIVVVAAVITPPDVVSQLMLAVPMYALFELGLFFARGLERSRR